jgi:hypothetical protein
MTMVSEGTLEVSVRLFNPTFPTGLTAFMDTLPVLVSVRLSICLSVCLSVLVYLPCRACLSVYWR